MIPEFNDLKSITEPLVLSAIRHNNLPLDNFEDIYQECYFIYVWCVDKFDRDNKFKNFYLSTLKNALWHMAIKYNSRPNYDNTKAGGIELLEGEESMEKNSYEFTRFLDTQLNAEERAAFSVFIGESDGKKNRRYHYMMQKIKNKYKELYLNENNI